jgi:hypothetical protein
VQSCTPRRSAQAAPGAGAERCRRSRRTSHHHVSQLAERARRAAQCVGGGMSVGPLRAPLRAVVEGDRLFADHRLRVEHVVKGSWAGLPGAPSMRTSRHWATPIVDLVASSRHWATHVVELGDARCAAAALVAAALDAAIGEPQIHHDASGAPRRALRGGWVALPELMAHDEVAAIADRRCCSS